jgi:Ca2+-binding EF-hand superfamily protein
VFKKTLAIATSTAIILGASFMACAADAGKSEAMFKKADTNADGSISKEEFLANAETHNKKGTKEEHMAKAEARFTKIDANADGKITPEEFKAHHEAKKAHKAEKTAK